jgi:hypothetical protein
MSFIISSLVVSFWLWVPGIICIILGLFNEEWDSRDKSGKYTLVIDGTISMKNDVGVVVEIDGEKLKISKKSEGARIKNRFKDGETVRVFINPDDLADFYIKPTRARLIKEKRLQIVIGILLVLLAVGFAYRFDYWFRGL